MKHRTGYLLKRGSNFYVAWKVNGKPFMKALRDENGQPITTRREAEDAKSKWMAQFAIASEAEALEAIAGRIEGRKAELRSLEDQRNPPLALAGAWGQFISSPNRPDTGPDTLAVYEGQWGQFVTWMSEQHPDALTLRDVTPDIATAYAGALNHGRLSPNTYNKHLNLLALVFRVLRAKAKLTENPWDPPKRGGTLARKRLQTHSRRELTIEELRRVCLNATGELRVLFALGVYTGLRLKDCVSLRHCEIDAVRNEIRRVPSKTARKDNPTTVIIPVHPCLRDILSELSKSDPDYILPGLAREYLSGGAGKKRVIDRIQNHFTAQGVRVYSPGTGPGTEKRAVVEVGFHSLRHSFVSLCRANNTPLAVVESIVGHSNPAMTRHYTHHGELAAGQAIAALPYLSGEPKKETDRNDDPQAVLRRVADIARSITGKNWKQKKVELLALFDISSGQQPGEPRQ